MRRLALFFIFIFAFSTWAGTPEIDLLVEKAIEKQTLPGGILIIGKGQKVIYRKSFQASMDTIYDLASLTKITTAMSILLLEEQHKLRVSDRLSLYYPEFQTKEKESITIEDLLRHRGGVAPSVKAFPDESYEAFIKKTLGLALTARPRQQTIYSDVGYIILGDLVQKVSGMKLSEFVSQKIFKPLAMNNSGYHVSEVKKNLCAPTSGHKKCIPHDPKAFHQYPSTLGHAGVFSTIDDLSHLAQMFLGRGHFRGKRILSEVSVHKMTQISSGELRGMGFDLLSPYATAPRGEIFPEGISYGHTGFTGTTFWIDPNTESFYIFLSNRVYLGETKTGKAFTELRRQMANLIGDYIYNGLSLVKSSAASETAKTDIPTK